MLSKQNVKIGRVDGTHSSVPLFMVGFNNAQKLYFLWWIIYTLKGLYFANTVGHHFCAQFYTYSCFTLYFLGLYMCRDVVCYIITTHVYSRATFTEEKLLASRFTIFTEHGKHHGPKEQGAAGADTDFKCLSLTEETRQSQMAKQNPTLQK